MENLKTQTLSDRVNFEAFGDSANGNYHTPDWLAPKAQEYENEHGTLTNIITSTERLAELQELEASSLHAEIAERWWPYEEKPDLNDHRWASYATSGTETQSKENQQVIALAEAMKENSEHQVGIFYMIDTASHPMRDQLQTEGKMYAAYSGRNEEEVVTAYLNLFKANEDYLEPILEKIDTDEETLDRFREGWKDRTASLDIPADAISLPDKEAYLKFLESVNLDLEVVKEVSNAFDDVLESRVDGPKTLGSLRCTTFTRLSNRLTEIPTVAVPFDYAANNSGWEDVTLEQIKQITSEISGGETVAYYNIIDPETGREVNMKTDGSGTSEFIDLVKHLPYRDAARIGHLSGMGYYAYLMVNGKQAPSAFVKDNYEASKTIDRIVQATNWRTGDGTKFVVMPRGWTRVAGFSEGPDATYGAAPPLEILASSPNKIQEYRQLLRQNIGQNTTIALDICQTGNKISIIPDNLAHAEAVRRGEEPIMVSLEEYQGMLEEEAMEKLPAQQLEAKLAEIDSQICEVNNEFVQKYSEEARVYFENRLLATLAALGYDKPNPKLLPAMAHWEEVQAVADKLFEHYLVEIKNAEEELEEIPTNSTLYPIYDEARRTLRVIQGLEETKRAVKDFKSLEKASQKNPAEMNEAFRVNLGKMKERIENSEYETQEEAEAALEKLTQENEELKMDKDTASLVSRVIRRVYNSQHRAHLERCIADNVSVMDYARALYEHLSPKDSHKFDDTTIVYALEAMLNGNLEKAKEFKDSVQAKWNELSAQNPALQNGFFGSMETKVAKMTELTKAREEVFEKLSTERGRDFEKKTDRAIIVIS